MGRPFSHERYPTVSDTPGGALAWTEAGPRSTLYDDIYYAAEGLAEARSVFLAGCGLPHAWAERRRFTVAELGFGTGLNILALLQLWRETRPPDGRLHVFSVEAHPLSVSDAARALAAFPEVSDLAARLLPCWPGRARGFERIELPELGAVLDVATAEAAEALQGWDGAADAWFLDGFAPSRNPEMWRPEVLDLVRARSAPGARLATFTVAGAVRRGLAERGFELARAPGHGRKKERLEARLPGSAAVAPSPARVAVVGAGVAGAALSRALKRLGCEVVLLDAGRADAASGNPAALVSPRLDAGRRAGGQARGPGFRPRGGRLPRGGAGGHDLGGGPAAPRRPSRCGPLRCARGDGTLPAGHARGAEGFRGFRAIGRAFGRRALDSGGADRRARRGAGRLAGRRGSRGSRCQRHSAGRIRVAPAGRLTGRS
jgi:tRNA U34 5-methylaminomethyl-2-thiouridine-forming methyltransferase MnmC